jgi:hypothetical protein
VGSSVSGQDPLTGFAQRGNKPAASIKYGEFLGTAERVLASQEGPAPGK